MKRLLLALLLLPLIATADPGKATRYLINEPASLLDIMMIRLNITLDNLEEILQEEFDTRTGTTGLGASAVASYDYENDLIVVGVHHLDLGENITDLELMEIGCRSSLWLVKEFVGTSIENSFSHEGYKSADEPEDLLEQVKKRVQLDCGVSSLEKVTVFITIESMLLSDDYSVTKHDVPEEN